jgi:hypothetical protein
MTPREFNLPLFFGQTSRTLRNTNMTSNSTTLRSSAKSAFLSRKISPLDLVKILACILLAGLSFYSSPLRADIVSDDESNTTAGSGAAGQSASATASTDTDVTPDTSHNTAIATGGNGGYSPGNGQPAGAGGTANATSETGTGSIIVSDANPSATATAAGGVGGSANYQDDGAAG